MPDDVDMGQGSSVPPTETRRQRRIRLGPDEVGVPAHGVWRTPIVYRLFFPAVGLCSLPACIAYFDGGSDLSFTTLSALLGLGMTIGPFMPVVRLEGTTVYARGLIFHRTFSAGDISEVSPSYGGLFIRARDGRTFTATGVGEKWNIAALLGTVTRADGVAEVIMVAAMRARGEKGA